MVGGDSFKNARELSERVVIVSAGEDECESKGRGWRSASGVNDGLALARVPYLQWPRERTLSLAFRQTMVLDAR